MATADTARGSVLTVLNHQCEDCGAPPSINADDFDYCGYFENDFGEQAVFVKEKQTGRTMLYMGDCGWERPKRVIAGVVPGINLGTVESQIVYAMWSASINVGEQNYDQDLHDQCIQVYRELLGEDVFANRSGKELKQFWSYAAWSNLFEMAVLQAHMNATTKRQKAAVEAYGKFVEQIGNKPPKIDDALDSE